MIETALILAALQVVAKRVLGSAGDDYLKGKLQALFKTLGSKKTSPESAAVAQSYKRLCETVAGGLGLLGEDPDQFKEPLEKFIEDPDVFLEFLKPFDASTSTVTINDEFLAGRWVDLGLKRLPNGFPWNAVAQNYKKNAQQLMAKTPELQGIAQVQDLRAIRDELRKRGPVVHDQDRAKYADYVRSYYRALDLSALAPTRDDEARELPLTRVFVPQSVRTNRPPVDLPKEVLDKLRKEGEIVEKDLPDGVSVEEVEKLRKAYVSEETRPVLDVVSDPAKRLTVILGDPGSGKSTLTRYLMLSIIDPPPDQNWVRTFASHQPLLIELRDFFGQYEQKRCTTFLDYLELLGNTENYALNATETDEYLKHDGRALVIFDGLDEIFNPGDRRQVVDWIAGFARHYAKVRILVTSRIIGYDPEPLAKADFDLYTLQDLDTEPIKTFARGWYDLTFPGKKNEADRRYERLIGSIEKTSSIKQLAGNPMLLTILAIIGRNRELPRERWRLYDHAADVLVHHWDIERHNLRADLPADFMNEEDKKQLLRTLAHHMQQGKRGLVGNAVTQVDLEAVFIRYFADTWKLAGKEATTLGRKMIDQFHTRNFILCKRGPKLYGFVHRAFLEYFCAAEFVERRRNTEGFNVEDMKKLFHEHWSDRNWHEVLRLICGMEADIYAAGLVRTLAFDIEKRPKAATEPPWSLVLAVQCFGEMQNLSADAELGRALLRTVLHAVEICCSPLTKQADLLEPLVFSVTEIGTRWPLRELVRTWWVSLDKENPNKRLLDTAATLFARLLPESDFPAISKQTTSAKGKRRVPSMDAQIAQQEIENTQTKQHLLEQARSEGFAWLREMALEQLAKGWLNDPETKEVLQDLCRSDPSTEVRRTAMRQLVPIADHDESVLKFLIDCAREEIEESIQHEMLTRLVNSGYRDARTVALLIDAVRRSPVRPNRPHTFQDGRPSLQEPVTWALHFKVPGSTIHEFLEDSVIDHLRRLTDDATLALVRKMFGSVILVLKGTREGYEQIQALYDERKLTQVAGYSVVQVRLHWDVFFSYNSQDREEVLQIADGLRAKNLEPWVDVRELRPGFPWLRQLEEQISNIGAAAAFVGEDGLGPWQEHEVEALLREFVERKCPVIPVILQTVKDKPNLPRFLGGFQRVDFRNQQPAPLNQLVYGILGQTEAQ